ncbi:MAG: hypothetical protein LBN20_02275 [Endomicrobium sp.]|jgi:superoxide reductase|nr:hypothetical protein [Endomicrobium sp.]
MKGFVCKCCGFVSLEGDIKKCPICMQENVFEEKEDAYKSPDFKAETGESEKKHIPQLGIKTTCKSIEGVKVVHVKVGEITHPMLPEHHIAEITFYLNKKFVSNVMLSENINPIATIHLKDGASGKVQVIETCNLHGKWFNEVEIK